MKASRLVPIRLPELGAVGRLSLWHVRPGDRVYEGDRVAEVLVPGATVDVAAPATGTFAEAAAKPNDVVSGGTTLGWVRADDE